MSSGPVTLRRLLVSEWTKLWSLRSTRWTLLVAFILMAALGPIVSAVQMGRWAQMSAQDRLTFDPVNAATGGWHGAELAIGVLGVLVISGEYGTGMIRSSLMAAPTRLPVLWAKLLVYAAVTFVLMLVASFVAFFASQPILAEHHLQQSLGGAGVLRTVIGCALYMTMLGTMCVGFGGLLRSTAGGLATFVALLFVLPGLIAILGSSLSNSISPYLPLDAGTTVLSHSFDSPHHLGVWGGFALFCGYTLVAIVAAAVTLMRRDA
jgi:ABC-type transport system involved in multi-copper enzyme maturation permease subunit